MYIKDFFRVSNSNIRLYEFLPENQKLSWLKTILFGERHYIPTLNTCFRSSEVYKCQSSTLFTIKNSFHLLTDLFILNMVSCVRFIVLVAFFTVVLSEAKGNPKDIKLSTATRQNEEEYYYDDFDEFGDYEDGYAYEDDDYFYDYDDEFEDEPVPEEPKPTKPTPEPVKPVSVVPKAVTKSTSSTKNPESCPCKKGKLVQKSCWHFTDVHNKYCAVRPCEATYECVANAKSTSTCYRRNVKSKIIKDKGSKCKTVSINEFMYVPYAA